MALRSVAASLQFFNSTSTNPNTRSIMLLINCIRPGDICFAACLAAWRRKYESSSMWSANVDSVSVRWRNALMKDSSVRTWLTICVKAVW